MKLFKDEYEDRLRNLQELERRETQR